MPANNCTVELETGTRLHLREEIDRVIKLWDEGMHDSTLRIQRLDRMEPSNWPFVVIDVTRIVAVYPLDEVPVPMPVVVAVERPSELGGALERGRQMASEPLAPRAVG
jgi:hypothetical protein